MAGTANPSGRGGLLAVVTACAAEFGAIGAGEMGSQRLLEQPVYLEQFLMILAAIQNNYCLEVDANELNDQLPEFQIEFCQHFGDLESDPTIAAWYLRL